MATIYLPEDQRAKAISAAMAGSGDAFMKQADAKSRAAAMQKMFESGNTDPFSLSAIAAGNPESEALLKGIWAKQQADVLSKLHMAETQKTQADTMLIPLKMQQTATQIGLEKAQSKLAEQHGALADAQAALTKFTAQKDVAQANEAKARIAQINNDIKATNTMQSLLQTQMDAYKDMQNNAPGVGAPSTGGGAAGPQGSATPGFRPAAATTDITPQGPQALPPPVLKPTPDAGLPPNYDLNRDPTTTALNRAERVNKTLLAPGTRASKGGFSVSTPALPPAVQQRIGMVQAFQQTIAELQQRIGLDKDGKLKMGPLSGRVQKAINAFNKDPTDPNVVMESLFGHEIATQFALMPNTRAGFNMVNLISGIVADMAHGSGEALSKLKQSARILRPEIGTLASEVTGKSGGNLDAIGEMNDLNKQMLTYDYKDPYKSVDDVSRLGAGITEDDINHTLQLHPEYTRSQVIQLYMQNRKPNAEGSSGGDSGTAPFSGQ